MGEYIYPLWGLLRLRLRGAGVREVALAILLLGVVSLAMPRALGAPANTPCLLSMSSCSCRAS